MVCSLSDGKYKDMFVIKGGYALASALKNKNLNALARATTDIDMWFFDKPLWKEFLGESAEFLTKNSRLNIKYVMVEAKQTTDRWRGGYIRFQAITPFGKVFDTKIDMRIGSVALDQKVSLPSFDVTFNAVSFEKMLADKLFNMTFWIIAKRPRDFYDVFALANLKNYKLSDIEKAWVSAKKYFNADESIYSYNPVNYKELERVLTDLIDNEHLPVNFIDLYSRVCQFTCPIFECLIYGKEDRYWDVKEWLWVGMD